MMNEYLKPGSLIQELMRHRAMFHKWWAARILGQSLAAAHGDSSTI